MVRKSALLMTLAAALSLAACNHGHSRHFGGGPGGPGTPGGPGGPTDSPDGGGGDGGGGGDSPPSVLASVVDGTTDTSGNLVTVAGNAVLGLGDQTGLGLVSHVGNAVSHLGEGLQTDGLGALPIVGAPLGGVVDTVDGKAGHLAGVTIINTPLTAPTNATPLIGASVGSQTPPVGSLATVGLLNQSPSQGPVSVAVGQTQVIGGSSALLGGGNSGLLGNVTAGVTGSVTGGVTVQGNNNNSPSHPVSGAANALAGALTGGVHGLLGNGP